MKLTNSIFGIHTFFFLHLFTILEVVISVVVALLYSHL